MIRTRALRIGISLAIAGLLTGWAVLAARPVPEPALEPRPPVFAELASSATSAAARARGRSPG
jgi:hypothetical protein